MCFSSPCSGVLKFFGMLNCLDFIFYHNFLCFSPYITFCAFTKFSLPQMILIFRFFLTSFISLFLTFSISSFHICLIISLTTRTSFVCDYWFIFDIYASQAYFSMLINSLGLVFCSLLSFCCIFSLRRPFLSFWFSSHSTGWGLKVSHRDYLSFALFWAKGYVYYWLLFVSNESWFVSSILHY